MNAKLLTDKALEDDIYTELMYMAGSLAYYRMHPEQLDGERIRQMINEQVKLLMPVVKRHIKRHIKATPTTKEDK